MTLFIDQRYTGNHGIARYAREVLSRFDMPFHRLPVAGSPTSPLAYVARGWRVPRRDDVIYSPGFGTGRSRARQLLTIHDLIHLTHPQPGLAGRAHERYYERLVKPAVARAGHVLTVSQTSATAIREWLSNDQVVVHTTGNACSEHFIPDGPRQKLDRPYVLYVGNTKPHKNFGVVVRALTFLAGYELVVVTTDVEPARRAAAQAGVIDRCHMITAIDDERLASYYRGARSLLMPSIVEGFGLPALEAIHCGTPVVYYQGCRAVAEIVAECGIAVSDQDDAEAFAHAATTLSGLAAPVRENDVSRPSWDSVAERVSTAVRAMESGR
ncbi:glycosyltransferase family 1 protein [Nocardioides sp. BP30]|uniref:glycosyltransferase family 4 protein n=1 Tax=Nocardioides sp. BP30 TaxID=3036374 RepID=UPI00246912ED|nr:glycosyltransferase family 1 protein [Nocardioides sp. BP30]WGL52055.1 glycosyltransferase family 1 protein [Nocardioides sp. BP30]